jgi:hypothetical protein
MGRSPRDPTVPSLVATNALQAAQVAPPDPAAARRSARNELTQYATAIRDLNQRARPAFDSGDEAWTKFDAEAAELLAEAATAVRGHLGDLEYRDFTEVPAGLAYGTIGQTDGAYLRMASLLSHRQGQLEHWVGEIPAL